ncbi:Tetratricopeptide repeat/TPR repeat [Novymonas esmeraldas]|uniref:Tetratricopeptide repeat/TPR repeat n=1 Tax=Novymonas esmeraldas TaxID=1808958 RepID=A0AAW0F4H5_9TRYP
MSLKTARTTKSLVEAARACLAESTFAPEKAADLLQTAVQQDPTYVNALVLRSTLSARLGHLNSALADMTLAVEVDKGNNDPRRLASLYGGRASLCYRMGRYADAVSDLRSALRWEPDNGMWCYELGRVHMRQGCVSLAQWCLQQALLEPMWSRVNEATRPKVYALYGRSCLFSHEYKKAKLLLHKSIEAGGEGPAAVLHDVGLAHYFDGTSLIAAVEYLTRATEVDPRPVDYPMHLSLALVRSDRYPDALLSMNEAVLRGHEEPHLRFYRGCIELQLGMGPQALMDLQATTATAAARPASAAAQKTAARACLAMGLVHIFCAGDLPAAAAALQSEALLQTRDVSSRLYAGLLLGVVHHEMGDTHAALRALQGVLQVLREVSRARTAGGEEPPPCAADMELLALTHSGLAYGDCGYADLAARHLREACQRIAEQHRRVSLFRLAVSQVELRDHLGALHTLRTCPAGAAEAPSAAISSPSSPAAAGSSASVLGSPTEDTPKDARGVPDTPPGSAPVERGSGHAGRAISHAVCHSVSPGEVEHLHAVLLRRLGRLEEALSYATAALDARERAAGQTAGAAPAEVPHGVPAYLYNRALILFSLARYADALADLRDCIQACDEHRRDTACGAEAADPHYLRGRIHHALGAHGDALASLTEALRHDPALRRTAEFAYAYGVLLAIAGRLDEALAAFTAAIDAHRGGGAASPTDAPIAYHHERAKVHQQLGRYGDALRDYTIVLERASAPSAWNALVNRALTLKELKRYDEAAMDWDVALRSDRSGLLAAFTSHDIFELAYMPLCLPGEELCALVGEERV